MDACRAGNPQQIYPAGGRGAIKIKAVPNQRVRSLGQILPAQVFHQLSSQIVDANAGIFQGGFGFQGNIGAFCEGVGPSGEGDRGRGQLLIRVGRDIRVYKQLEIVDEDAVGTAVGAGAQAETEMQVLPRKLFRL